MTVMDERAGTPRAVSRRRRRLRRILKWTAVVLLVLALIAVGGVTWYYSDQLRQDLLVVTHDSPEYTVDVLTVEDDRVVLERTDDTVLEGIHGLEWPSGYGQVDEILALEGPHVEREFRVLQGSLAAGDRVRMDRWAFPEDPELSHGIAFEDVTFPGELGEYPAWMIRGNEDTWVVFVHGKGATRREALRTLPVAVDLGLPSLPITYRNDEGAPASGDGRYGLGNTEWKDLEAAVDFAMDRGAGGVVLVGYSMGGAIVTTFLLRSSRADLVRGVILDAPVLDWGATVDLGGEQRGLPQALTSMAKSLSAIRFGIDWDALEKLDEADRFDVPILLFHGDSDGRAPIHVSDEFAAARPDIVTYVRVDGAEHVGSWNVDPGRYESHVRDFLKSVALP
jgi:hypothetical protein